WKAIHIIAVISWMAGLLYLLRLFIYHNQETEYVVKDRFQVMERRLLNFITTPAAVLALISGVMLLYYFPVYLLQGWFHTKILGIAGMMFIHFKSYRMMSRLKTEDRPYSNVGLRFLNEIPTLLMIGIVILVVLKPF
ncbi:MAG: CopD family protein, partial [Deltaproteobacteria bacterium]|nr:CopD family protein [Deltaproteobacteria bacterium]